MLNVSLSDPYSVELGWLFFWASNFVCTSYWRDYWICHLLIDKPKKRHYWVLPFYFHTWIHNQKVAGQSYLSRRWLKVLLCQMGSDYPQQQSQDLLTYEQIAGRLAYCKNEDIESSTKWSYQCFYLPLAIVLLFPISWSESLTEIFFCVISLQTLANDSVLRLHCFCHHKVG